MLIVRLRNDYVGREQRLGPLAHVVLRGAELELPGHGTASFHEGRWLWDGGDFLSLETEAPSVIQLSGVGERSVLHGPFDCVRIIGGLIHVNQPDRQPFARLDTRHELWNVYADLSTWPDLAIFAAGDKPPTA